MDDEVKIPSESEDVFLGNGYLDYAKRPDRAQPVVDRVMDLLAQAYQAGVNNSG